VNINSQTTPLLEMQVQFKYTYLSGKKHCGYSSQWGYKPRISVLAVVAMRGTRQTPTNKYMGTEADISILLGAVARQ
jgi:hypothetical protein